MKSEAIALFKFLELCNASIRMRKVQNISNESELATSIRNAVLGAFSTGKVEYAGYSLALEKEEISFLKDSNKLFSKVKQTKDQDAFEKMLSVHNMLVSKNREDLYNYVYEEIVPESLNDAVLAIIGE